jgi:hypothetical protein
MTAPGRSSSQGVMLTKAGRQRHARGGELLRLGLRHGDEQQPRVEDDGKLAPGEVWGEASCGPRASDRA